MKKSISIVKEVLAGEKRVIALPHHVKILKENDFTVFVESNAGEPLGFDDNQYQDNGAIIVDTKEAWEKSDFIIKYKALTSAEYKYLREGLNVSAIFHAEGNEDLIRNLCATKVTAYSYEFFQTEDGVFPLAIPGGEIAGKVAFFYAAYFQQVQYGGGGVLLSDVIGVKKPKVVVIGYGNVGNAVIQMARKLGNEVVVFGTNIEKMRKYHACLDSEVKCMPINKETLISEIKDADAVFGAILISTFDTPPLIDEYVLSFMKKGAILVDITCGYGSGYMPTFKNFTSLNSPIYEYNGILHCKIDNLPAAYPSTTTQAFVSNALPYIIRLGNSIYDKSIVDTVSEKGKIIDHGEIVHPVIQQHIDYYESMRNEQNNV